MSVNPRTKGVVSKHGHHNLTEVPVGFSSHGKAFGSLQIHKQSTWLSPQALSESASSFPPFGQSQKRRNINGTTRNFIAVPFVPTKNVVSA